VPATLCHCTRQFALRPTSSSFRVLAVTTIITTNTTKTITFTIHPHITAGLLELDKNIARNCFARFDISLRTHCDRKGHRLFAPGAFPPQVNETGLFEHIQHHTTTRPSARRLLSYVTNHCRRRAPRSRRSAPARQNHNNGLNTASNLAPRTYTTWADARTATRQLRAVLSPPKQAQYCAEQPLRLNSLRPHAQSSLPTRNHPSNHQQESPLRPHTYLISTFITTFASPTPSSAQDATQNTRQSCIGRRAQRLRQHLTTPPSHPTFHAAHTQQDTQETQRRIHEQHRPCPQFPALLAKRRHALATQDEEVKSQVLSWLRSLRGRLEWQPGADPNFHRHQRSCSGARWI
jgi:hypothetical protein